jgi:predicted Zn-dependent protease
MSNGLKKFVVACLSVMLPLQSLLAQSTTANDLPDIGSPASAALSLDDEFHIGLQVMRQLRDEGQILEDPEATEYLQALGSRIVAQATETLRNASPSFSCATTPINAFALPAGSSA